ncbi:hypothetical protein [Streptomyces sp. NPDC059063]|uniref:hypothetical protein n=1 Tax=unclassified Streptomyces TaxID=2593676 RepID=UPI0036A0BBE4
MLQLVAGFVGLAVLPLAVAAAMHATDAFRAATASHPPAADLADHIVVGLDKVGTRVLAQLGTTQHPVVAVERDPAAREANPDVRVVMRLHDDDFAATVSRTLRASCPRALTLPQALNFVRAGETHSQRVRARRAVLRPAAVPRRPAPALKTPWAPCGWTGRASTGARRTAASCARGTGWCSRRRGAAWTC